MDLVHRAASELGTEVQRKCAGCSRCEGTHMMRLVLAELSGSVGSECFGYSACFSVFFAGSVVSLHYVLLRDLTKLRISTAEV